MNCSRLLLALLVIFILSILIKLVINIMSDKSKTKKYKLKKIKSVKPIVILLDMDRNIIGDISPQLEEYYIIKNINQDLKSLDKKQINFNFQRFKRELSEKIIRPYILKFLKLTSKYDNLEIYMYTASDDSWAKILIPQIEKVLDFKFNRPLFTRKHTVIKNNRYKKSINLIKPLIFKDLKRKYNLQNINEIKHIILFDDTKNVLLEKKFQINSPEYNYIKQIDYLRGIPNYILQK